MPAVDLDHTRVRPGELPDNPVIPAGRMRCAPVRVGILLLGSD